MMGEPAEDRDFAVIGEPGGFLIQDAPKGCLECWACVRHCPARAIRVIDGRAEVIKEKCVKCGLCVSDCGNCGHLVRDDTAAVEALLASGRPVVGVLATEFVAAMYPLSAAEVETAMEAIGFYAVESTLLGEEIVAGAYERLHARECGLFVLRSTCPVAVMWVQRYHPALVGALAPVVPPYVAQARLIKELYPEDTAVVYVSPCYARKDEVRQHDIADAVDVAIDFVELKRLLGRVSPEAMAAAGSRRPSTIKEVSLTDGFPRRAVESAGSYTGEMVVTRGLRELEDLLCAMEHGEAAPEVVDMLNCEGCIDGPAVSPGMSVFAKRNVVTAEIEGRGTTSVGSRALLRYLPSVELRRSFHAEPVILPAPTEEQIDAELLMGEFKSRDELLDCGACGSRTCVEHAAAILRGDSSWDICFPLQKRRLARCTTSLSASSTLDALTGLWNRRVFSERLAEEVQRAQRYDTQLSLLMLDVDDFKRINDTYGHLAGDAVLEGLGGVMRECLRTTDMPARFGGDEFAVILPGIGSAAAMHVAEKLRGAVSALALPVKVEGYTQEVGLTVSVGVASLGDSCDATALLEAADRAMYGAKGSGKDRVGLSTQ